MTTRSKLRSRTSTAAETAANRASAQAEDALRDGAAVARDAGAEVTDLRERIADTARHAARDVKGAMDDLVSALPQDSAAHRLADTARDTADAAFARIREIDPRAIPDNARDLVRRHPVAAGVGAAVVGFALVQLARSVMAARNRSPQ